MLRLIAKLGEQGTFGAEEVCILVAALEAAWTTVKLSGAPISEERYSERVREILAQAIILAAKLGERNEHMLTEAALLALSKVNLRDLRNPN